MPARWWGHRSSRKPGDGVKTNRRDSVGFATPPHGGELTAVWVPDESHEAMRDLPPARAAAGETGGYIISRSAASCSSKSAYSRGLDHALPEMAAVAELRSPSPPDRAPGDGRGRAAFEGTRAASRCGDRGFCRIGIAPIVQALQGFQLTSERKPLLSMHRGVRIFASGTRRISVQNEPTHSLEMPQSREPS
jgi:hypothetical protein